MDILTDTVKWMIFLMTCISSWYKIVYTHVIHDGEISLDPWYLSLSIFLSLFTIVFFSFFTSLYMQTSYVILFV